MVVFYRLSIVTVALSVTIRPQFAIECLRRSNQQVVGHFGPKIFGCSTCSRPMMFGSAESEHPRLTNGEIISEEFQPVWSQSTNVTDGQTDDICDRKTALCTKVHRAVKIWASVCHTEAPPSFNTKSLDRFAYDFSVEQRAPSDTEILPESHVRKSEIADAELL